MKKFFIMIVTCTVLGTISFNAIAQQKIDSTTVKVKLEKFQKKEHTGKIMTLIGIPAIVIGAGLIYAGFNTSYAEHPDRQTALKVSGILLEPVGIIMIIPGAINWSVGKKKVKEYQIRLDDYRSGFYYGPNQAGLKLAFKF